MNIPIYVIASKITDGFVVIDTVLGKEAADAKYLERQGEVQHHDTLLGRKYSVLDITFHGGKSDNRSLYTKSGSFVAMKRA
jgi:hypothetical protein